MKNFLILLLIFAGLTINSQSVTTFQRTLPTNNQGKEFVGALIETNTSEFMVAGATSSFGAGLEDGYIMKTNSLGLPIWAKTYGGNAKDHIIDLYKKDSNTYYFTGVTTHSTRGEEAMFGKLDGNGNLAWVKTYGGSGNDATRRIVRDNANNFYLVGYGSNIASSGEDILVLKVDSIGGLIWSRSYGTILDDRARYAQLDSKGNLIVSGWSDNSSVIEGVILKLSPSGSLLWSNNYSSTKLIKMQEFVIDASDNIYVTGKSKLQFSISTSRSNHFLMKLDSSGTQQWLKIYEDRNQFGGFKLSYTHNNTGFIMAGDGRRDYSGSLDTMDCYYMKTDLSGNITWSHILNGTADDRRPRVIATKDGGYLLGAHTASFSAGDSNDIYLIKTNSLGASGCNSVTGNFAIRTANFTKSTSTFVSSSTGITQGNLTWSGVKANFSHDTLCQQIPSSGVSIKEKSLFSIILYPNPTTQFVTLSLKGEIENKRVSYSLIDLSGRVVISNQRIANKPININLEHLKSGTYIVQVMIDGNVITQKLIKY
ncbi:MAG: T9SS type A sorting domain-containing protein [Flavobacteriales bacterium]